MVGRLAGVRKFGEVGHVRQRVKRRQLRSHTAAVITAVTSAAGAAVLLTRRERMCAAVITITYRRRHQLADWRCAHLVTSVCFYPGLIPGFRHLTAPVRRRLLRCGREQLPPLGHLRTGAQLPARCDAAALWPGGRPAAAGGRGRGFCHCWCGGPCCCLLPAHRASLAPAACLVLLGISLRSQSCWDGCGCCTRYRYSTRTTVLRNYKLHHRLGH